MMKSDLMFFGILGAILLTIGIGLAAIFPSSPARGYEVPKDTSVAVKPVVPPNWKVVVYNDDGTIRAMYYSYSFEWCDHQEYVRVKGPSDGQTDAAVILHGGKVIGTRLTASEVSDWKASYGGGAESIKVKEGSL